MMFVALSCYLRLLEKFEGVADEAGVYLSCEQCACRCERLLTLAIFLRVDFVKAFVSITLPCYVILLKSVGAFGGGIGANCDRTAVKSFGFKLRSLLVVRDLLESDALLFLKGLFLI